MTMSRLTRLLPPPAPSPHIRAAASAAPAADHAARAVEGPPAFLPNPTLHLFQTNSPPKPPHESATSSRETMFMAMHVCSVAVAAAVLLAVKALPQTETPLSSKTNNGSVSSVAIDAGSASAGSDAAMLAQFRDALQSPNVGLPYMWSMFVRVAASANGKRAITYSDVSTLIARLSEAPDPSTTPQQIAFVVPLLKSAWETSTGRSFQAASESAPFIPSKDLSNVFRGCAGNVASLKSVISAIAPSPDKLEALMEVACYENLLRPADVIFAQYLETQRNSQNRSPDISNIPGILIRMFLKAQLPTRVQSVADVMVVNGLWNAGDGSRQILRSVLASLTKSDYNGHATISRSRKEKSPDFRIPSTEEFEILIKNLRFSESFPKENEDGPLLRSLCDVIEMKINHDWSGVVSRDELLISLHDMTNRLQAKRSHYYKRLKTVQNRVSRKIEDSQLPQKSFGQATIRGDTETMENVLFLRSLSRPRVPIRMAKKLIISRSISGDNRDDAMTDFEHKSLAKQKFKAKICTLCQNGDFVAAKTVLKSQIAAGIPPSESLVAHVISSQLRQHSDPEPVTAETLVYTVESLLRIQHRMQVQATPQTLKTVASMFSLTADSVPQQISFLEYLSANFPKTPKIQAYNMLLSKCIQNNAPREYSAIREHMQASDTAPDADTLTLDLRALLRFLPRDVGDAAARADAQARLHAVLAGLRADGDDAGAAAVLGATHAGLVLRVVCTHVGSRAAVCGVTDALLRAGCVPPPRALAACLRVLKLRERSHSHFRHRGDSTGLNDDATASDMWDVLHTWGVGQSEEILTANSC
ncbi:hypothetical protein HDU83_002639 [Entophlyctis luteolus]|nr:hypothetical protein HDU83_002639 [Entophlyctis luteolus]